MLQLQQQFNQHWHELVSQQQLTISTQKVVLAFSGGVDSSTLLDLLMHLPQAERPQLILAYFNHQLRADSDAEESLVKKIAVHDQVQLQIEHWQHGKTVSEAAARMARYDFLATVLQDQAADYLLTAHHGDDLLETILLKLIRSGSVNELPGLKEKASFKDWEVWRPLLPYSKEMIREYATAQKLAYIEDSTNQLDFTPRNRLRHHIVPILKQENPKLLAHVNRFATELTTQQQFAHQFLGLWYEKMDLQQKNDQISGTFPSLELDLMGWQLFWQDFIQLYLPNQQMCDQQQLLQIAALTCEPTGHHRVDLSNDWSFYQTYNNFTFQRTTIINSASATASIHLQLNQWQQVEQQLIGVFSELPVNFEAEAIVQLQLPQQPTDLILRHRLVGDRLQLTNGHWQKLSRRQIDLKIPFAQRDRDWVLVADQQIVWVQNIYHYKLSNVSETAKIIYVLMKNNQA